MNIANTVKSARCALGRRWREGARYGAWATVAAALVAAFCAAPIVQAGPLRPGEILVADGGFEDLADGAIFRVDPVTGERAIISGRGFGSGPELFNPLGITLGADRQIYVTDTVFDEHWEGTSFVYRIDPVSGHRVEVSGPNSGSGPGLGERTYGITLSTAGSLYVATSQPDLAGPLEDGAVFLIDLATGDRSVITGPATGQGPILRHAVGVRVDLDGSLLVLSSALTRVDPATGDRTSIRPPETFVGATDGAVRDHTAVFVADFFGATIYNISYDSVFQQIVSGPTLFDGIRGDGPAVFPFSIEFDGRSEIIGYGSIGPGTIVGGVFRVDVATGDRTVISGAGVGIGPEFINVGYMTIVPVPEPGTLAGALAGIAVLALRHWLRRQR